MIMPETQRLMIRPFAPSDAYDFHACLFREQVTHCEPCPPFARTSREVNRTYRLAEHPPGGFLLRINKTQT